jgi:hypothetical protein
VFVEVEYVVLDRRFVSGGVLDADLHHINLETPFFEEGNENGVQMHLCIGTFCVNLLDSTDLKLQGK